ncbi:LysR family transcriptional regulator [Klebsiella electrica]|uniref:LysR family transcriptional regulator n=1 Tax=Klebsiella electrica TaxID=1259973 RepID=A0AAJ5QX90_9ENTR|nr:LysR family transcriptional regulator [Klebsiella electrica]QDI07651.1 Morphology and auto-aggregation control protein [Klebsiella electrica]WBW62728.1 LysR family transcriptional regulator [Klebsiella electrica]WIO41931.1 LysR family transcriptional regulator [Klebsiella electrica]
MINANRPILNLDLDLLRTFVAVADLNTFAAAAAAVCRTQSAVSQQMQRLEQLVGKELFARHGRNKLLTEQGIQLLGYARKILRFNDEACMSLMFSSLQGILTIGASDETAETILPFLLNRIGSFYPKLTLEIKVLKHAEAVAMLASGAIDLALTTHQTAEFDTLILRTSPTLWYCAADYVVPRQETIPLILLEEPGPFREEIIAALNAAGAPWHLAHSASTLAGVKAAVKAGLGVTARPVEMMSPELRVVGKNEGLPALADTQYVLSCNAYKISESAQAIFQSLSQDYRPWSSEPAFTPEGGDNSLIS